MADFSIDLAKLGEKDSTFNIGNFGKRNIERVSSHDDGPEDFTLRLGEWMRGTMPAKPQADANPPLMASAHASEIETLKNELQACRTDFQHREDDFKEQLRAKELIIRSLKDERATTVAISTSQHGEVQQAQEQLTETRRILRNVEDENDLLTQENERQLEAIGNLQQALDEERLRIPDSVDAQLANLQDEITHMQNQKTADTISYSDHRAALDKLQDDHTAATEALTTKSKKELNALRAAIIKAGEGMKKREDRLTASHEKESTELKLQASVLREELQIAATKNSKTAIQEEGSPTVLELRSALLALNNRLSTTNQSLKQASAEAEHYRHYVTQAQVTMKAMGDKIKALKEEIKSIKEENEDINREMDEKTQRMMEDREREWRRRIKVMFKERETMAKALMTAWGRQECGVAKEGEKQKYRYKYVDKEGKLLA